MDRKVTQKYLRQLIAYGIAGDARELTTDELYELYRHTERVAYSIGTYGLNGCLVRDTRTGELWASPARNTATAILY